MDALSEKNQKGRILAVGMSAHSFEAVKTATNDDRVYEL